MDRTSTALESDRLRCCPLAEQGMPRAKSNGQMPASTLWVLS